MQGRDRQDQGPLPGRSGQHPRRQPDHDQLQGQSQGSNQFPRPGPGPGQGLFPGPPPEPSHGFGTLGQERGRDPHPQRARSRDRNPQRERSRDRHPQRERSRDRHPQRQRSRDRNPQRERSRDRDPQRERSRDTLQHPAQMDPGGGGSSTRYDGAPDPAAVAAGYDHPPHLQFSHHPQAHSQALSGYQPQPHYGYQPPTHYGYQPQAQQQQQQQQRGYGGNQGPQHHHHSSGDYGMYGQYASGQQIHGHQQGGRQHTFDSSSRGWGGGYQHQGGRSGSSWQSGYRGSPTEGREGPHSGQHGGRGRGGQPPYDRSQSRTFSNQGAQLESETAAKGKMLAVLQGKPHQFIEAGPTSGSSSLQLALRPGHGTVLVNEPTVLVNLFELSVSCSQLFHYDVSFERRRSARPQGAGPSSAAGVPQKPPDNARDIMCAFQQQYVQNEDQCVFDGARNMLTRGPLKLRGGASLPEDLSGRLEVTVRDVPVPSRGKTMDWTVTFQLARVLDDVHTFNDLSNALAALLAVHQDTTAVQQFFDDTRQALEWVIKQALVTQHKAMEVKRTLYFNTNIGNRNIGGGLQATTGLSSGIKLGEKNVFFAADLTVSAFLRTDINLVQWMAEVGGYSLAAQGGRGSAGGRGGPGGRGGGGGRGRSLPEVGPPDVRRLLQELRRGDVRRRLLSKCERQLRNKKVVYKDREGKVIRKFTAVGLTQEPADRAMFFCKYKQPIDGRQGEQLSVAQYYGTILQQPLEHPELPVVVMKMPKPKEGEEPRNMWIPLERLCFDKNQRVQAITHRGGVEQMIEAARKQPQKLADAIQEPIVQVATTNSSSGAEGGQDRQTSAAGRSSGTAASAGQQVLNGMQVGLGGALTQVKARVLPGPWLRYKAGSAGREETKASSTGTAGTWNMFGRKFAEPAKLQHWGVLAVLPQREFEESLKRWLDDCIQRFHDLGMDLRFPDGQFLEGHYRALREELMQRMVWLDHEEAEPYFRLVAALEEVRMKAGGPNCQLILCFIRQNPSSLYSRIKVASELQSASGGMGLVTQVVVASKTDLGSRPGTHDPKRRSQYQANLALKVNAKVGGVNTCWSVLGNELLRGYFNREVPAIQVFGIDINHPGQVAAARSKAAVVGSTDPAFCRYAQSYWEEDMGGSEAISTERLKEAFKQLMLRYYKCNNGQRPGCLLVYRDGVSDSELARVRNDEVSAIIEACAAMSEGDYRPRIVYVVVQKRHHLRMFQDNRAVGQGPRELGNLHPGTVIDHTIVSPAVYDFYLNSHKEIPNTGTSRAARYICLLDELGFGPDGLQVFTYWMCYLYCRCTRAVSIVAPVYYAHLLAYRVRVLDDGDGSVSSASGSSGAEGQGARQEVRYCDTLADKMFFV